MKSYINTFTLVNHFGITFLRPLTFFWIHSKFLDIWSRFYISKVFGYFLTISALLFVKVTHHIRFHVYQIYKQDICQADLLQKLKFLSVSWNLSPRLIQICRIQWWCSPFLFEAGNTSFWQIWSKQIKIVALSWNLVLYISSVFDRKHQFWDIWSKNSKLSVDYVQFFLFRAKIHFLGKFGPKIKNWLFKVKLGVWANLNMQNSVAMFTFFHFPWEIFFVCVNLVQKIKIVSLSRNFVPKLIRICVIQW